MAQETYLQSLVKVGSVTAEVLLIWTNIARSNVAWKNFTMTVTFVKDGPGKLALKFM